MNDTIAAAAADTMAAGTDPVIQDTVTGATGADTTQGGKGGEGSDGNADETTGAPESYEAFKLPEGVKPDEAMTKDFSGVAKELNLSQDQAQKLADFYFKTQGNAMKGQADQIIAREAGWLEDAKKDKTIGGDKFEQNMGVISKALKAFGDEDVNKFLDQTGGVSHPGVLRMLFKIGSKMGEDGKLVKGANSNDPQKKPLGHNLWPNAQIR